MLATMALSPALAQPASAHGGESTRAGVLGGVAGHCVNGNVRQAHGWHWVNTFRTTCNLGRATWHAQYQEYYKVRPGENWGTYCFEEGWHESGHQDQFFNHYGWDIWNWCNNGVGVWVVLTIDSWHDSWKENHGWVWPPGWRPATSHCHCP